MVVAHPLNGVPDLKSVAELGQEIGLHCFDATVFLFD
jgi:hypothetical protein